MQLTYKQLYELAVKENLPILGHDGLPFQTMTTITAGFNEECLYFRHDDNKEFFDFVTFFPFHIPSVCHNDLVAGECEIHEENRIRWIGVDLYNEDLEKLIFEK